MMKVVVSMSKVEAEKFIAKKLGVGHVDIVLPVEPPQVVYRDRVVKGGEFTRTRIPVSMRKIGRPSKLSPGVIAYVKRARMQGLSSRAIAGLLTHESGTRFSYACIGKLLKDVVDVELMKEGGK
jgi:hypothetical protein